jgi:long-subunit acyl-CoA synthetase (AMP-forming)
VVTEDACVYVHVYACAYVWCTLRLCACVHGERENESERERESHINTHTHTLSHTQRERERESHTNTQTHTHTHLLSGTTSKPKGVLHTHASIAAQVTSLRSAWKWSAQDVALHCLPLHHIHGILYCTVYVCLYCGLASRARIV